MRITCWLVEETEAFRKAFFFPSLLVSIHSEKSCGSVTKIFLLIPDSLEECGTSCGALRCGYLWDIVSKAFLFLLLLRKASVKTQNVWNVHASIAHLPKAPSSFPLTKKITVKFSPDNLVAQKQQWRTSPQCLFISTQKDSNSCNVSVFFQQPNSTKLCPMKGSCRSANG